MLVHKLHRAKKIKNDEFYTLYEDIEKMLVEFKDYLKDKIIYLPCDNPEQSNFYKYFLNNYKSIQPKMVLCSFYKKDEKTYYTKLYYDNSIDRLVEERFNYNHDGDFAHPDNQKLMEQCDIVITNPPYSLLRKFFNQILKYDKKYLLIVPLLFVQYKDTYPYIRDNKAWFSNKYPIRLFYTIDDNGNIIYKSCNQSIWFNNITDKIMIKKPLTTKYNPDYHNEKCDTTGVLNINKVADIPYDYNEEMAVPCTYIFHFDYDMFEILGMRHDLKVNGVHKFKRLIIKRRKPYNE